MRPRHTSIFASTVLASALVLFASSASAQDPAAPAPGAAATAAPAPAPAPTSPAAARTTPSALQAPTVAAASAPAPNGQPITATCTLGEHAGIEDAEAHTAADVVCHELARQGATNAQHEVRMGKLGGKTLVTLAARSGNTYDERRAFVAGLDELNVAAPRLVSSLVDGKPIGETRDVDNVLASETRQAKVQRGQMGFDGGIFGSTGIGSPSGSSAGIDLGLLYRAGNLGLGGHGRAGGIGSNERKMGSASIDIGARYYLTNGDFSPFAAGGLGLSYFRLNREKEGDLSGSGFGAFAQVGAEMLRTHHTALSVSFRLDMPFYELEGRQIVRADTGQVLASNNVSQYVMPLSLNLGLVFH
jgi:hypothetical protein